MAHYTMTYRRDAEVSAETRKRIAEDDFRNADQLVAASASERLAYGVQWFETFNRLPWVRMNEAARKKAALGHASRAVECARAIVADGRAHYVDRNGMLVVCSLVPDASAGAVGYLPWDKA